MCLLRGITNDVNTQTETHLRKPILQKVAPHPIRDDLKFLLRIVILQGNAIGSLIDIIHVTINHEDYEEAMLA